MEIILMILNYGLTALYIYMGAISETKITKGMNYAMAVIWFAWGVLNSINFYHL